MSKTPPQIPRSTHLHYLRQTIELAQLSAPQPSNFRVGCVIVSYPLPLTDTDTDPDTNTILSTGYTLQHEGNTHAEQCALEDLPGYLASTAAYVVLYTSLEPCGVRLSGTESCVSRIVRSREVVDKVVFGAKEPATFVRESRACEVLTENGVEWEYIPDLEREVLRVAMEGHVKKGDEEEGVGVVKVVEETRIDDLTEEERQRQLAMPRNPKKRMFEVKPGTDEPV